jgi:hypothetical protein
LVCDTQTEKQVDHSVFRPHLDPGSFLNTVAGCFPNFIAAFLISLSFIVAVLFKDPAFISSAIVFFILTVQEFNPIWGASTHFDSYDILASGLGSALAILFFEIIYKRKQAT